MQCLIPVSAIDPSLLRVDLSFETVEHLFLRIFFYDHNFEIIFKRIFFEIIFHVRRLQSLKMLNLNPFFRNPLSYEFHMKILLYFIILLICLIFKNCLNNNFVRSERRGKVNSQGEKRPVISLLKACKLLVTIARCISMNK